MHKEVIVRLSGEREYHVDLERLEPMGMEDARRWLDEQFTELECEPLRASGKVLLADKVLVVAQAANERLLSDETWLKIYARATHAVLAKPIITVDVSAMAVTY